MLPFKNSTLGARSQVSISTTDAAAPIRGVRNSRRGRGAANRCIPRRPARIQPRTRAQGLAVQAVGGTVEFLYATVELLHAPGRADARCAAAPRGRREPRSSPLESTARASGDE
ncbi:MAG: hypothetical protein IT453_09700 [Planctomycetes bacterium]|nr:hypothetical protein [Planctomycetota bacterium]